MDEATVHEAIGAEVEYDSRLSVPGRAACSFIGTTPGGHGMRVLVEFGDPTDADRYEDGTICAGGSRPIGVDGVRGQMCEVDNQEFPTDAVAFWGEDPTYKATISYTPKEYTPPLDEVEDVTKDIVRDLVANVDESLVRDPEGRPS